MKTFENEWIIEDFDEYPSFRKKSMFGGLAVYLFERQMLLIVEPTKSGRWNWHGVLVCTDFENQESIMNELPELKPHEFLKKWLYIDTSNDDFESTMEKVTNRILKNDIRFGIYPKLKSKRTKPKKK